MIAGHPGVAGACLDLALGGHVFSGTVDGNDVRLTIVGTRAGSMSRQEFSGARPPR